jgi:protein subunit release factor B
MEKKREETRKTEASKLEINFGSQIHGYVLAPYRLIKDHRTKRPSYNALTGRCTLHARIHAH